MPIEPAVRIWRAMMCNLGLLGGIYAVRLWAGQLINVHHQDNMVPLTSIMPVNNSGKGVEKLVRESFFCEIFYWPFTTDKIELKHCTDARNERLTMCSCCGCYSSCPLLSCTLALLACCACEAAR